MFQKLSFGAVALAIISTSFLALGVSAMADPKEEARKSVWTKRCEKDSKYCEIFQRLEVTKTKQRLLEVAIGFPKNAAGAQAVLLLPLGLFLPEGVTLHVDGQPDIKSPITTCTEIGCVTTIDLSKDFLGTMKKAERISVQVKDNTGKPVKILLSLQGFADNLSKL